MCQESSMVKSEAAQEPMGEMAWPTSQGSAGCAPVSWFSGPVAPGSEVETASVGVEQGRASLKLLLPTRAGRNPHEGVSRVHRIASQVCVLCWESGANRNRGPCCFGNRPYGIDTEEAADKPKTAT